VTKGAAAVVGVLAGATIALAAIVGDPFGRTDEAASPPSLKARTASCSGPASEGPCADHSASPTDSAIPPGAPRQIAIPAIGLHTGIADVVSTHVGGRWTIDPPKQTLGELRRVYWWSEHAAPADPSTGAAYLYGHACTSLDCAFNKLDQVSKGDLVRVTTRHGVLSYRVVAEPMRLAKTAAGIGSSSIYNYKVANRLLLITCGYTPDGSSPFNWVVVAHLSSATAAP
jgi:hypothetical protein